MVRRLLIKKPITILFLLFLATLSFSASALEGLVSRMAANINTEAPVTSSLPDGTQVTMMFASSSGKRLTYHYQLHAIKIDEIDRQAFKVVMKPIVQSQICTNPVAKLMEHGIELAYSYLDADREYLSTFVFYPGDC
jgi:hypothetical protein